MYYPYWIWRPSFTVNTRSHPVSGQASRIRESEWHPASRWAFCPPMVMQNCLRNQRPSHMKGGVLANSPLDYATPNSKRYSRRPPRPGLRPRSFHPAAGTEQLRGRAGMKNTLLGEKDGERLDPGTACSSGRADSALATAGEVNGAEID